MSHFINDGSGAASKLSIYAQTFIYKKLARACFAEAQRRHGKSA
jgi:hypothetical protein